MKKPAFELVQNQAGLHEAVSALRGAERLYLDTEFESTREGTTLCLLQLSRGETIYLIDTLRLSALEAVGELLSDPNAEWVLHAGQQDAILLSSRFGLRRPRIFDTQVAWALLGPEYSVSLAYLRFRLLGIRAGKTHQADDWKRRPLPLPQLAYAASDIEHLPELRRMLGERAAALGREELVIEASREAVWPEPELPAPLTLESFRNAWQLDPANQAALRVLIDWYNALPTAAKRGAPEPKTLLSIASRLPQTVADLARIKGVARSFCDKHGVYLISALKHASAQLNDAQFQIIEPPTYASFDEIRLDGWLAWLRGELCAQLSEAPELALPGRVLKPIKSALLAERDARVATQYLTGWREPLLASAWQELSARQPPPL